MTSTASDRPGLARPAAGARVRIPPATRTARTARAALLAVAAGAWAGLILWDRSMGNGPGTMGLGVAQFMAMWSLMVTAMMLPLAARAATGSTEGARSTVGFGVGYLAAWVAVGGPGFGVAALAGRLAAHHPAVATTSAVAVFIVAGLYQVSGVEQRSLERCRVPLAPGDTFAAALWSGVAYSRWCLACTWGAMALMIAFGLMNIGAMAVLGLVIYTERFVFPGPVFSRLTAVACMACGVAVVVVPPLAAGLHHVPAMAHQMPAM